MRACLHLIPRGRRLLLKAEISLCERWQAHKLGLELKFRTLTLSCYNNGRGLNSAGGIALFGVDERYAKVRIIINNIVYIRMYSKRQDIINPGYCRAESLSGVFHFLTHHHPERDAIYLESRLS